MTVKRIETLIDNTLAEIDEYHRILNGNTERDIVAMGFHGSSEVMSFIAMLYREYDRLTDDLYELEMV